MVPQATNSSFSPFLPTQLDYHHHQQHQQREAQYPIQPHYIPNSTVLIALLSHLFYSIHPHDIAVHHPMKKSQTATTVTTTPVLRPQNKKALSSSSRQLRSTQSSTLPPPVQNKTVAEEDDDVGLSDDDELDFTVVNHMDREPDIWTSSEMMAILKWISHPDKSSRLNYPSSVEGFRLKDFYLELTDWLQDTLGVNITPLRVKSLVCYVRMKYLEATAMTSTGPSRQLLDRQEQHCPPFELLHRVFEPRPINRSLQLFTSKPFFELPPPRSSRKAATDSTSLKKEPVVNNGAVLEKSEDTTRYRLPSPRSKTTVEMTKEAEWKALAFIDTLLKREKEAREEWEEEVEEKRQRLNEDMTEERRQHRAEMADERQRARMEILEDKQIAQEEMAKERDRLRLERAKFERKRTKFRTQKKNLMRQFTIFVDRMK
ncbi:hypothetical protein EMPS_05483 [Entomortierella parvispora]|uniref:Uncharacterized protein n=1 Tax=Entomortierella parvispora TaxID=205924 RepID=A0A9P3HAH3_9FUNG|nr:hypothetical protein EMPS_05483 [Entomortierella parvispora]